MKKILIVNNQLEVGGVQTSLLNLLKEIHNKFDVTLLLFNIKVEYMEKIPPNVKVITTKSPFKHFGMLLKDVRKKPFLWIKRAFWVLLTKIFGRAFTIKLMLPFQKKLSGYDCAISFLHESSQKNFYGACNDFVLDRTNAKMKIGWIHGDFSLCGANNKYSHKLYPRFDKVVACSEGTRDVFLKCIPACKEKCFTIRNCNDYEMIKLKSQPAIDYNVSIDAYK